MCFKLFIWKHLNAVPVAGSWMNREKNHEFNKRKKRMRCRKKCTQNEWNEKRWMTKQGKKSHTRKCKILPNFVLPPKKKGKKLKLGYEWDAAEQEVPRPTVFRWMKTRAKLHGWGTLKLKYSKGRLWLRSISVPSYSACCLLLMTHFLSCGSAIVFCKKSETVRMYYLLMMRVEKSRKHPEQIIPSESEWLVVLLAIVWVWRLLLLSHIL